MRARQLTASRASQDDQFNPTGATESQGTLANLGLSKEEGARVSEYYWAHMNHVYAELIKRGKFAWQLLWTGQPDCPYKTSYGCLGTTGTNILISKKDCAQKIRAFCKPDSQAQTRAMMSATTISLASGLHSSQDASDRCQQVPIRRGIN